ncbi:tRNA (adenosine(37)-N6)-dimethylallyltransferase MiaA [Albibacterium bauzanense]|uniref:tRNA dimethylallyltransferase n=1 Tax=Albibacterium bauzanense TaxID=653929 RepID=A0A4R1LQI2_9SPHI|nr:tRNA (adenosine(37)-N6)-dimethylallyltransferase MiaA [Albibacterium bauzanense]TCK80727.1 tRNA dimethylallyltransferase [Albibacterium bauzanense]
MTNLSSKNLICIVGPTGIGKTALAIELAKKYRTDVVSADSRQFYREMNIGTAKPDGDELQSVTHHFINSHSIHDNYSAGDYERDALDCIDKLFKTTDTLILVGGSGLFVNAVCKGLDNLPKPGPGIRENLTRILHEDGILPLQELLKKVDINYYNEVDINNPQRIIRALEVYETTQVPFSVWRKKEAGLRKFNIISIGLNTARENLYNRINHRVDLMIQQGLLDEVKNLYPYRDKTPLLSVGYTELFDYLDNKYSLDEAIERIKQNTRRYAKRQLTWFKKNENTKWFEPNDSKAISDYLELMLRQKA